ncbi:MAG: leucine-rich repeat domain-containing protein, partial [Candidatus Marinimicrobia bacterium]|nr:leucine-rich repeat domain-containing protein [Candidatus Neomarinimicrobiota bacterium]
TTIAAVVLVLFGGVNEVNGDPLKYEVVGDTVTIKDCKETASGALAIPSIYEGKPVTSIGDWAFYGCNKLTSVTIPDSVTGIGYAAFSKCGSLKNIDVGESNTEYLSEDGVLFDKNKTVLIHFPAGKGGHYTIPDGVTSIGDHAFIKCISLTSVTIPDSVIRIGALAFRDCFGLKSVRIPGSITNIKSAAFSSCSNLTSIFFEGNAPFSFHVDVFSSVSEDAKIFINPEATGFGKMFAYLPVIIFKVLKINTFRKIDSPFTISFESNSGLSYIIEVSHNLKQWVEIGEVQGTGSLVKFTDPRLPIVPFGRNYFRVKLAE